MTSGCLAERAALEKSYGGLFLSQAQDDDGSIFIL